MVLSPFNFELLKIFQCKKANFRISLAFIDYTFRGANIDERDEGTRADYFRNTGQGAREKIQARERAIYETDTARANAVNDTADDFFTIFHF
jgi:hypothetical protein